MKKTNRLVSFFRPVSTRIRGVPAPLKTKTRNFYKKISRKLEVRPLSSFFVLLIVLALLIVVGNFARKPKMLDEQKAKDPISVETYTIGNAPKITVPAQIEKEGVIQITSQTSAIVNKVNVKEGQYIEKGKTLISLASNYQGASASSVQRQLAGSQAKTAKETYIAQKDIIAKQKEIADKTDANADELRSLAEKSQNETKSLVALNETILSAIGNDLKQLEATNVGGVNDNLILQSRQLQSQFLSATNQAKSTLRNSEFQSDTNKPPSQLSDLQKDVMVKQLDLQEKTLKLNLEAANLQLRLTQINESAFFPTAPFSGTVERVHVRVGEQVSPGKILVTISSQNKSQTAVAYVPKGIALGFSKLNSSYLIVDKQKFEVNPLYISQEAIQGQLYAIIFPIPKEVGNSLTDKSFIDAEIPIGYSYTSQTVPYIPLDAVHQTQNSAVVFVVKEEKAEGKTVTLGEVQGNFIEVTSGLDINDIVIVNRNIVSGDLVKANNP